MLIRLDARQRPHLVDDDPWQLVPAAETAPGDLPPGAVLVPLACWQAHRQRLQQQQDAVGVWLAADQEAEALTDDLQVLTVIGLDFPVFSDGRNLSNAALLRRSMHWHGELRALGDVHQDQLAHMRRCGIDAFQLAPDENAEQALAGLFVMSDAYQGDARQPDPAFRRGRRA